MQNKELINISQATKGKYGVYSIEFHETQNYTHVKRVNSDGSETLFPVGGNGGGVTYTAGTGIDITNGVISSTVVDSDTNTEYGITLSSHLSGANLQLLGTNSSVDVVTILPGNGIAMSLASDELTISSTATDTNDFVSSVSLSGTDLEFVGTGGAFNGTVSLASLGGGSSTESNIVPYAGGTINTDGVSLYGLENLPKRLY